MILVGAVGILAWGAMLWEEIVWDIKAEDRNRRHRAILSLIFWGLTLIVGTLAIIGKMHGV
jgi:hypothetical protein